MEKYRPVVYTSMHKHSHVLHPNYRYYYYLIILIIVIMIILIITIIQQK